MRAARALLSAFPFILTTGCNDETTVSAVSAAEWLPQANTPSLQQSSHPFADSVGVLSGTIVVQRSADTKTLVTGVDTVPTNGSIDRLFVLQSEANLEFGGLRAFSGRVHYENKLVRVNDGDRTLLTFGVASDGKGSSRTVGGAASIRGFGLSRRTGSYTLAGGELSQVDLENIVNLSCAPRSALDVGTTNIGTMDMEEQYSCTAGGPGSTSCSISCLTNFPTYSMQSCSTTCQSGYYACCYCLGGDSGCTCVKTKR